MFSKRVFSVVLVLLLGASLTVMPAHSTGAVVSVVPTVSTVAVGEDFTVNFTAASVTNLYCWQVVFKYNTTTLNCTGAWIPDDNVFAGHYFIVGGPANDTDVKDRLDYIELGASLSDSDKVDVTSGILFKANFTVMAAGSSPLTIATASNPAHKGKGPWPPGGVVYSFLLDGNVSEMPFTDESGVVLSSFGWVLTITVGQGGATVPVPGLYVYPQNGTETILALPTLGYEFDHWKLDGANVGSSNPYTLTMTSDHTLEAEFRVHVPKTWTVDNTGPADFHTISDAISSPMVVYGDVVLVKPGVYPEHVALKPGLKIIGEDRDATIIDGSGQGVTVTLSNNSYVGNLTVQNGNTGVSSIFSPNMDLGLSYTADLVFPCLNNTIENIIVRSNIVGGVFLGPGSNGDILNGNVIVNNSLFGLYIVNAGNNNITNNMVQGSEHGIVLGAIASNNVLRGNRMVNNTYNFGVVLNSDSFLGTLAHANDIDSSNTVDGRPVYCWFHEHDKQVPSDAGFVWLLDSDNITVQGLNLSHNLEGILLASSNNIVIADNVVEGNVNGVYLYDSANATLTGNTILRNRYGLYIGTYSFFTVLKNNSMMDNNLNFGTDFDWMDHFPSTFLAGVLGESIDSSNTVNGKPIYFWINQHDRTVPSDAGCVILVNSSDILLENLKLSNNVEDIFLLGTNNTTIKDCEITNSSTGIDLAYPFAQWNPVEYLLNFNISISHSYFRFNARGIFLLASNSTLSNNRFFENLLGIQIQGDNNLIENNVVTNNTLYVTHYDVTNQTLLAYLHYEFPRPSPHLLNEMGIYTYSGDTSPGGITILGQNNTVFGNTFAYNEVGAYEERDQSGFHTSDVYYHNNFISNIHGQVFIAYPPDAYNSSYPIGGNYWSDYRGSDVYSGVYQNESGSDEMGDTPYVLGKFVVFHGNPPTPSYVLSIMDDYPLMKPYVPLSLCDLDGDGVVSLRDVGVVARAFGSSPDNPRWNAFTDMNYDGKVDLFDVATVARAFGKHTG